jgi:putative transposase
MDETYVKVKGRWTYLYRAVDRDGQTFDFLLSARRDLTALDDVGSGVACARANAQRLDIKASKTTRLRGSLLKCHLDYVTHIHGSPSCGRPPS